MPRPKVVIELQGEHLTSYFLCINFFCFKSVIRRSFPSGGVPENGQQNGSHFMLMVMAKEAKKKQNEKVEEEGKAEICRSK